MKFNTAWLEIIKQSKEFIIKLCLSCIWYNNIDQQMFNLTFSVTLSQRQNELTGMLVFSTKPMEISHRFNFKWFHWNKKLMFKSYYTLISKPIVHSFKLPCNKHRNSAIVIRIIKIIILYTNIRFGLAWEKRNNMRKCFRKKSFFF